MSEDKDSTIPYKPGDRVVLANDAAKAQVGADRGVVVGATAASGDADEPKVVVALNKPVVPNAVISKEDLESDSGQTT